MRGEISRGEGSGGATIFKNLWLAYGLDYGVRGEGYKTALVMGMPV